jgi:DNA primase
MAEPGSIAEKVKQQADIVRIVADYVRLKKSGQNFVGLCPFHSEKTPSFAVHPTKQIFHCFGCGVGGDVFKFVMDIEKLTFPEAMKLVADKAGVKLPERRPRTPEKPRNAHPHAAGGSARAGGTVLPRAVERHARGQADARLPARPRADG